MGFLLLSVKYPTKKQRNEYLRQAGSHTNLTSPTHKPLAVSANEKQWKYILKIMLQNIMTTTTNESNDRNGDGNDGCNSSNNNQILRSPLTILNDKSKLRPLKPDDDNYKLFTGPKWIPDSAMHIPKTNPIYQMLDMENEVIPYYDHCAYCTKPNAIHKCSRCKFVRYCCRECQSSAWSTHKKSCVKAQRYSLHEAMHGNDGFYITIEECQLIANSLKLAAAARYNNNNAKHDNDDDILRCFRVYFESVQELDGCFML